MPSFDEVAAAARRLQREGGLVSVRRVRAALPRGGSPSKVAPMVALWKAQAGYVPPGTTREVPAALAEPASAFLREVWEAALRRAETAVEGERRRLEALRTECLAQVEAAWIEVDVLAEEVGALRRRLGDGPVPVPVVEAPPEEKARSAAFKSFVLNLTGRSKEGGASTTSPGRKRSFFADGGIEAEVARLEAGWIAERPTVPTARAENGRRYWAGVIRDAADVIRSSGRPALGVAEILEGLRSTRRAGDARFAKLGPALLRRKLTERAASGKLFAARDDGSFGLLGSSPRDGRRAGPSRA